MMGPRQVAQGALFYEFNLEDHVPGDHLLRSIDRFVDLSGVRDHLAPFYSSTGRPSIDPELMIRMLIIGYTHGIRSERRLCQEVHLNLAYRWFCRLDLTDPIPDHSTFFKTSRSGGRAASHGRFRDSDLFRKVFEDVVARCIAAGVVGGEHFATDASLIQADANKLNSTSKEDWDPDTINPEIASRAVVDYLFALDDEAFGAATDVTPKFISHSDPGSQWTAAHHGPALFAYSNNCLIDTDHTIILDVQASRSVRTGETHATRTMIDRVRDRFDLWPERLIADTAYGSGEMLGWLVEERAIEPHTPMIRCPSGALRSKRREGTSPSGRMARSRGRTSSMITGQTPTPVPPGRSSAGAGASSRRSDTSPRTRALPNTGRSKPTARPAIPRTVLPQGHAETHHALRARRRASDGAGHRKD